MRATTACMALSLLSFAQAVSMKDYDAAAGMDAGFEAYLQALYTSAETLSATTTFADFFTPSGQLVVMTDTATGSDEIIELKQQLLPPAGNKHWNHLPNAASVDSETDEYKRFLVLGNIQTTYDGGNCSQAVYKTRFTVLKTDGLLDFVAHAGNLIKYDDFLVDPSTTPTDIPCDP